VHVFNTSIYINNSKEPQQQINTSTILRYLRIPQWCC
jgi:hypothetical protein